MVKFSSNFSHIEFQQTTSDVFLSNLCLTYHWWLFFLRFFISSKIDLWLSSTVCLPALSTVQHRVAVPLPPLILLHPSQFRLHAHPSLYSSLTATTLADATTIWLICANATVPDETTNPTQSILEPAKDQKRRRPYPSPQNWKPSRSLPTHSTVHMLVSFSPN